MTIANMSAFAVTLLLLAAIACLLVVAGSSPDSSRRLPDSSGAGSGGIQGAKISTGLGAIFPRSLPAPREDFFVPANLSYHNVATLGLCPRTVVAAATAGWEAMEADPAQRYFGGGGVGESTIQLMERVRVAAAAYVGCAVDETVRHCHCLLLTS